MKTYGFGDRIFMLTAIKWSTNGANCLNPLAPTP